MGHMVRYTNPDTYIQIRFKRVHLFNAFIMWWLRKNMRHVKVSSNRGHEAIFLMDDGVVLRDATDGSPKANT